MEDQLIDSISYVLPAVVVGFVAYYFFREFFQQQNNHQKMMLLSEKKKDTLPIKLQAYERMLLFCDRINPMKLVIRVEPTSENVEDYLQLLIKTIDQEFEHNFVQQLYISDQCWAAIKAAKHAVVNKLKLTAKNSNSAKSLRENILIDYSTNIPPTETATEFIKNEIKKLL